MRKIVPLLMAVIFLTSHNTMAEDFTYTWSKTRVVAAKKFIQTSNSRYKKLNQQPELEILVSSIVKWATKRNIDPVLLLALIANESSFRHKAKNQHSIGPGQINWSIWEDDLVANKIVVKKKDLFNVDININASTFIIAKYQELCAKWYSNNSLNGRGYHTVTECVVKKYRGADDDTNEEYWKKAKEKMGSIYAEYADLMWNMKETNGITPKIAKYP